METAPVVSPSSSKSSQIPIIDISKPSPSVADEIVSAAITHGFLFIKTTGLSFTAQDMSSTFSLAKAFFASPLPTKQSCVMQPNNRGWTAMGSEVLDPAGQTEGDPKEGFNFGEFVDGKAQQPLPPLFEEHEAQLSRFSDLCYDLCLQLLRLFAIGLQIDADPSEGVTGGGENWFASRHDPSKGGSGTILRLLHYPASHGAARIRAGAHSDYGSLTLLFRLPGQAGLEVLTPEERWATVPVQPAGTEQDKFPPILVNIGDLLSYWTNGLLKSTVHRVVGSEGSDTVAGLSTTEDRYSIAFFCHPIRDTELVPVPSVLVQKHVADVNLGKVGYGSGVNQARYTSLSSGEAMTAQEHLQGRLAATYGWGKEVKA